jgi:hypothetical protein
MNMNRVIPNKPSWRERELEKEKQRKAEEARKIEEAKMAGLRKTEDNFPSLGGNRITHKPLTNSGLFAKMARDWKEKEDTEAIMERQRKEDEERERVRSTMYTFRASRVEAMQYDYQEYEAQQQKKTQVQPDGWTCVNTKKSRPIRERRDSEEEQEPEEIQVQNEDLADKY